MPKVLPMNIQSIADRWPGESRVTKRDLGELVAQNLGISQNKGEVVINAVLATISDVLVAGKTIEIRGFGVFSTRIRKGHPARMPSDDQLVKVPDHYTVKFKPSKIIREILDKTRN